MLSEPDAVDPWYVVERLVRDRNRWKDLAIDAISEVTDHGVQRDLNERSRVLGHLDGFRRRP